MKVQVMQAWLNYNVKVQRQPANPGVNSLGEPNYQDPTTWPVIPDVHGNATHTVRIEFNVETTKFTATGDRVIERETLMFLRTDDYLQPQDRITIININNVPTNTNPGLNNYFIVYSVWPENDSVGNVNHYVAELQVI